MTDQDQTPMTDGRQTTAGKDLLPGRAAPGRAARSVVHLEQAVYGSFAFRGHGYEVLAQSPGCRPEWLAEFRAACQKTGERPAGAGEAAGLFALRLPCGIWAVGGV